MFFATLLLAAEEAAPPLIDLDATVVVQFALFLIMFVVLRFLVFKPYLKMRDDRKAGIDGARHSAHEMEAKAKAIVADYDAQLQRAKVRGADERAKVRSEAAVHERQVLGAARDEAQRALVEARAKVTTDAATARKSLEAQSALLAKQMTKKILGREVA